MERKNLILMILINVLWFHSSKAHHSVFAEYDINGSITIEGVVTEVWFKNPHVKFFVEVTSKNGQKVIWNTHGHNPSMLRRSGWVRDTLKVGEKIIMSGDPTYDGSPKMFIRKITLSDGSILQNKVGGVN
jgi:hypothetical protein|tara:strand:+ start:325 stop:714 length:390 start_codon:yes stop_codon:yes gene_type:complete